MALEFLMEHKLVIGFYLLMALLVFAHRKKFQFQLKFIAIYRTRMGLGLMDRIASRHRELVKLLGYIGIGASFLSMLFIVVILGQSVVTMLTQPEAQSPIAPVLPGVRIPGVSDSFFVPFIEGIIAIFIIAVVHEFAHGVVARAHNVTVKSSGPAIIGPIFAAFVEPDEEQMKKKDDVINYSIFAAGTFSNILLALLVMLLMSAVFVPVGTTVFREEGVAIKDVTPEGPAATAGIYGSMTLASIDGQQVKSLNGALAMLQSTRPNQTVVFSDGQNEYRVIAGVSEKFPGRGHFGIGLDPLLRNEGTPYFKAYSWLYGLLALTATLSFGIGIANMIPIGPLDGGKMLHLALKRIRGDKKGDKTLIRISVLLLIIILFLLSPIFRAVAKSVVGAF